MKSLSLWNHVNNPTECNWWLMELAYWYKSGFVLIFLEFIAHKMQNIILCERRFNPCKMRLNWTLKNLKCYGFSKFSEFSVFSDLQFNLFSSGLNLTSNKPTRRQIHPRWDLMSHPSEILHPWFCNQLLTSDSQHVNWSLEMAGSVVWCSSCRREMFVLWSCLFMEIQTLWQISATWL